MPTTDLTAFVLAGGKSTRMGSDKALLEFDGRTLLSRAMEVARIVAEEVIILGSREKYGDLGPVVEDIYPERGPLGGIHAALSATRTELNLVVAVDVPFVPPEFLQYLVDQARISRALVTVPCVRGRFHSVCAVYRRRFCQSAERALDMGENQLHALFTPEETRVIDEEELQRRGFSTTMFKNLNTVDELEKARQEASGKPA